MSTKWSYSGDPSSSQRDAVRFRVGDTNPGDQLLTDAEIDYLVATEGSTNEAAIAAVRSILAKITTMVSTTEGKESKERQQRVEHYQDLVKQLSAQRHKRVTGVYAGGISVSDRSSQNSETDRDRPAFSKNMHDSPSLDPLPDGEC